MDELLQMLEGLEEWAEKQAADYRTEGFKARKDKQPIKEAIYIGREFAFMIMQFKIREILKGQSQAVDELAHSVHSITDPRD